MEYQSIEEIVKNSSAEQKIVWNEIFLRFGERCAVLPLSYIGVGTDAPYATYRARQIYFAYLLEQSVNTPNAVQTIATFYNELNNTVHVVSNVSAIWNATSAAINYIPINTKTENIWFGRFAQSASYNRFIGYKIVY